MSGLVMVLTCRNCGLRVGPCNCGAANGKTHWVDTSGTRWCSQQHHFEAPLIEVQPHAPAPATEEESL